MPWLLLSFWFTRCFFWAFALFAVLCIPVCGGDPYGSFQGKDGKTESSGDQSWMSRLAALSGDITYHCAIMPDHQGQDFSSLSAPPFYGTSPLNNRNTASVFEIGARYDRALCYVSLGGGRPTESGFLKDFSSISQMSMGVGLRYYWSDTVALQLAATLHYAGSLDASASAEPTDLSTQPTAHQPMSDLNDQVNGLSSASGGSFAEGLFTVVYYFCK